MFTNNTARLPLLQPLKNALNCVKTNQLTTGTVPELIHYIFSLGLARDIANLTSRASSDHENQEVTPDTDNESQEPLQRSAFNQSQHSFKRSVPTMGNRGLETRNSKRQIVGRKPEQSASLAGTPTTPVVGALEVQNVKKAINRYGTLPKGARIGAYLESLRQPEQQQQQQQQLNSPGTIQEHSPTSQTALQSNPQVMLSPRAVLKSQPQMIRSNSSGGVTMTNNANASLNKLQRHRTTTDSSLITFSSFRSTGSPKRIVQPTLADLEFPPPPIDLPPPPEEFENPTELTLRDHGLPPHPHIQVTPNNDVSNTEPSVEEASTRFGVSLRRREPSTDSCSSLGSPADGTEPQPATSIKEKLGMKLVAEIKEKQNKIDPASRLLSELELTMAAKHEAPSYKSSDVVMGRKMLPLRTDTNVQPNFKAQLKKVEPKRNVGPKQEPKEESTNIIDFKSRLRKVENQGNTTDSTQGTSDSSGELLSAEDLLPPPPPPPTTNRTSTTTNGNSEVSGVMLRRSENNKQKTEIKIDVQAQKSQVSDPSSDEGKVTHLIYLKLLKRRFIFNFL